ncbi:hypothetical protein HJFPF1_05085 [Paramyrothecium foliicola]|nr:hypothetical protein HJFPF1_05085 [Paramyrothecium foliicola]
MANRRKPSTTCRTVVNMRQLSAPRCIICGYSLRCNRDDTVSWYSQYRILYTSESGPAITGVGEHFDPGASDWAPPLDSTVHHREDEYEEFESDFVVENGMSAHVHEACWAIFEKARHPDVEPLDDLLEIRHCLPLASEGTSLDVVHPEFGAFLFTSALDADSYSRNGRVYEEEPIILKFIADNPGASVLDAIFGLRDEGELDEDEATPPQSA